MGRTSVRSGAVLGMFPEGTRSKDGTPGKPKSGVAMIASQTNASVLPCAVCYGKELRFRTRLTIRYGPLIPYERLGFSQANAAPREIKAASRLIMDEIVRLLGRTKHERNGCKDSGLLLWRPACV